MNQPETEKEEKKESTLNEQVNPNTAKEHLFLWEMGFSLVVKAIIEAKKPLVGHNCMYDWLYMWN